MGRLARWRARNEKAVLERCYRVRNRTRLTLDRVASRVHSATASTYDNLYARVGSGAVGAGGVLLGLDSLGELAPWLFWVGLVGVGSGLSAIGAVFVRRLIYGEPQGSIINTIRLGGGWMSPTIYIESAVDTPMMRVRLSRYVTAKREVARPSIPVEIPWSTGAMREPFARGDVGFIQVGRWRLSHSEACVVVGVQRLIVPVCGIELDDGVYQSWLELEFTAQGVRAPQRIWFTFTVSLDDDGEIVQLSGVSWPGGVAKRILEPSA